MRRPRIEVGSTAWKATNHYTTNAMNTGYYFAFNQVNLVLQCIYRSTFKLKLKLIFKKLRVGVVLFLTIKCQWNKNLTEGSLLLVERSKCGSFNTEQNVHLARPDSNTLMNLFDKKIFQVKFRKGKKKYCLLKRFNSLRVQHNLVRQSVELYLPPI